MFVALFTNSILSKIHRLIDIAYNVLDTLIYYVINSCMMCLIFTEFLVEFMDKLIYNYNILVSLVRHKMYNNIN